MESQLKRGGAEYSILKYFLKSILEMFRGQTPNMALGFNLKFFIIQGL